MDKNIQVMAGHYLKLLVCFLFILNAEAHGVQNVSITILHNAVEKGAVCLDGSAPAYYHDKGYGDGANNWVLFIQGGAWCYDDASCLDRLKIWPSLASSDHMVTTMAFGGILNQNQTVNPDFYNWNRVVLAYCDGGSFSGDVEEVNPVIFSGQSAGGLAAMLHCDQFRAQLPNAKRVKCLVDGGYFIQGKDIPGATEGTIGNPLGNILEYHGMEKLLPKVCASKMDKKSCLFPDNFVRDIETPTFLVNSAFDFYQIMNKVPMEKPNWVCLSNLTTCRPIDKQYMTDFRTAFLKALPKGDSSVGYYVNSCYIHDHFLCDGRWNNPSVLSLKNKTVAKAFGDWYFEQSGNFQEIDTDDIPRGCWC